MNPQLIPTNFKVPRNCRHEFLIYWHNHKTGSIRGIPGRFEILFETWDFPCNSDESATFKTFSLNWMAESVEHLRAICLDGN